MSSIVSGVSKGVTSTAPAIIYAERKSRENRNTLLSLASLFGEKEKFNISWKDSSKLSKSLKAKNKQYNPQLSLVDLKKIKHLRLSFKCTSRYITLELLMC
jgi:predicted kinase